MQDITFNQKCNIGDFSENSGISGFIKDVHVYAQILEKIRLI